MCTGFNAYKYFSMLGFTSLPKKVNISMCTDRKSEIMFLLLSAGLKRSLTGFKMFV